MADKKTYVHITKFEVAKIFDSKYGDKLPDVMTKAAAKVIDKSDSLTTKSANPRTEKGFDLGGSLESLEKSEKDGKVTLVGSVKLQMSSWPNRSMFAFPTGTSKVIVDATDDLGPDVEFLARDVVQKVVALRAVKEFESRTP